MKWKFCEFCYINGHCENQDRGYKCECYGKKLEDKCEHLEKQLLEIKDAYIDLTTQDEYGSYYIEEAKDFVDIVGRILKESGLLQELEK